MTRLVAAVLFSVGVMSGQQRPVDQSDQVISDLESYAVLRAALSGTGLTLLAETRPVTRCPSAERVPPEWQSVLSNHAQANARIRTLRADADLGVPYTLLSMADLRSMMRTAGYDLSKHPGSNDPGRSVFSSLSGGRLIAVSAPGFDTTRTRAMVTVQYDCFPRAEGEAPYEYCHEFHQVMLERTDGQWVQARGVPSCEGIA